KTKTVHVGLVGVGGVCGEVHYPGIMEATDAKVVALADTDGAKLARRAQEWGVQRTFTDPLELLREPEVDAVVLAVPNVLHAPLAIAAAQHGKHVLCEKPLAMNLAEARDMLHAVQAARVRHMTAFTYRFVPAMRYLKRLIEKGDLGEPRHFRAQRFQDWPDHALGWRQWKRTAGTGELGDMCSHRIDFGHYLIGDLRSVCAHTKQFLARDTDREGRPVPPSDTEDWVAILGEFANGATAVWESTKLARGHGRGGVSHDFCEVNGREGSAVYELCHPYQVKVGRRGGRYQIHPVPPEFMSLPGSRRPTAGDPTRVWRYDQAAEFIAAIQEGRDCQPSFRDGVRCQAVLEAVVTAIQERRWVEVIYSDCAT
ncbi:MAG: Gfo/Idh/MocA family oxidoreductase, partial [Planctomycetes bacterium]|nr:Gfo/Idh/MocA family oxidoreductase [Planctomycetota bacterium]